MQEPPISGPPISGPPIPSPQQNDCPRCGAPIPVGQNYCPNCGAALQRPANAGLSVLKVIGAICLSLVALAAGAIGSCAAILTPFTFSDFGSGAAVLGIAIAGFGVAAACIYGIVRIVKR